MKVAVAGLWHLGSVTAACLAEAGHQVQGWDPDAKAVEGLAAGRAPLAEPGLDALIAQGLASGRLSFHAEAARACAGVETVWIAFDTPVDEEDRADVAWLKSQVEGLFPLLPKDCLVLVSSQVPVGTTAELKAACDKKRPKDGIRFAYSPENLRLGGALKAFRQPGRVVAGVSDERSRQQVAELFAPVTAQIEWMSVPSAEMVKHALNSFLAFSVVFINEIAGICERTGADAKEVERGLKSEERIGPKAYLGAGGAIAGGTLARDLRFLTEKAKVLGLDPSFFLSALESNQRHKDWPKRRLQEKLGSLKGRAVGVLGLAYKAGTDTLRRSEGLALCRWLKDQGARVTAFDPLCKVLPAEEAEWLALAPDLDACVRSCEALVLASPWPELKAIDLEAWKGKLLVDPAGFLWKPVLPSGLDYCRVGK